MNITAFAQQFNLSTDAVRFYEKSGLLRPKRQTNGYRTYTETDQQDLKIILALKELDFSIKEINYLLELKRQPISIQCNNDSTEFLTNKIDYIKQRITFFETAYHLLLKLKATIENNNYAENQAELFALMDQLSYYGL
ncbi:MerR family transcriptional regulator [Candidatus Enterococcus ikei]|uniref:MerR family transcriptional regulator n=1 Tax=Candidatus Enterococcus ikei TaxID=2815326 RepID=A0ABS3H1Z8_9ENTE|nr:MerR family transcriptional regulator [Enterococcus sp. DIV0869a]MBO0441021.1 MerR family transcriptional regulator [Enterococcus sp. DIV0869a]